MLLPALQQARERARHANCTSNLKQIATYWAMYASENNDNLLPVILHKTPDFNTYTGSNTNWYEYLVATYVLNSKNPELLKDDRGKAAEKLFSCPADTPPIRPYQSIDIGMSYGMNPGMSAGAYTQYSSSYTQILKIGKNVRYADKVIVFGDTWRFYKQNPTAGLLAGQNASILVWTRERANIGSQGAHGTGMNVTRLDGSVQRQDVFYYNYSSGKANIWDVTSNANLRVDVQPPPIP
jgi:hypothetical protein